MAESAVSEKRYAVVTGSNKGIGYGIVKQLASKGIIVVLTARDEKKGLEAIEKLKASGISSHHLLFHQLDVSDSSSVDSLAQFIHSKFGKLDILVNNAGIGGFSVDIDALKDPTNPGDVSDKFIKYVRQNPELAPECIQINYYGAKKMIEAFIPLLQNSKSPRIVNVSSTGGQLKNVPDGHTKDILTDVDNLTEDKINQVIDEFLQDLKNDALVAKGWTYFIPAYTLSKASLNAYTRIASKKYPNFKINCVCPGFVKTDITYNTGILNAEEGAAAPVKLALLPDDGPSGLFFLRYQVSDF